MLLHTAKVIFTIARKYETYNDEISVNLFADYLKYFIFRPFFIADQISCYEHSVTTRYYIIILLYTRQRRAEIRLVL